MSKKRRGSSKVSLSTRHNTGKLRWALLDFEAVAETVAVLEFGANKYDPDNWKKGLHREEILESTLRHLLHLFKGKAVDDESGLPHEAHIICNAMFYSYHRRHNSFSKVRANPFKKTKKRKK